MKRAKRRKRHFIKQKLRELDTIAQQQIYKSYNLCMDSWGGSRCPGCGQNIRPYMLLDCDFSSTLVDENGKWAGHISGCSLPCDRVKRCPRERDWI